MFCIGLRLGERGKRVAAPVGRVVQVTSEKEVIRASKRVPRWTRTSGRMISGLGDKSRGTAREVHFSTVAPQAT